MGRKNRLDFLDVATVHERPGDNPNVVSQAQMKLLENAILKLGFLQPVTVRQVGDKYELIDGHHRLRAAKTIGLKAVPALITDPDDLEAAAETLSLNRLRGEVDLGRATAVLKELAEQGFEDLTLTGFSGGEITALLKDVGSLSLDGLDNLGEDAGADAPEPVDASPRKQALKLIFDKAEDVELIRDVALRNGPTVEAGLLNLCAQEG